MHSKDWQVLSKHARRRMLKKDESILRAGDSTKSLMLLAKGGATEQRIDDVPSLMRRPGTFWGELTWSLGASRFDKSPCAVIVTSDEAELWEWDYGVLDELTRRNARLLAALRDGFLRSACFARVATHTITVDGRSIDEVADALLPALMADGRD